VNNGFLPLYINDIPVFAIRVSHLLDRNEIMKLEEYVDLVFANVDGNRRKKYAVVNNKKAVKRICKRIRQKQYRVGDVIYDFDDYCEQIEIIQWQKDKFVSDISHRDLTKRKYCDSDIMYVTCVIGLGPQSANTKVRIGEGQQFTKVRISGNNALMYYESHISLQEEISTVDHTQIYFHMIYRPKVEAM
jgi:hypothetical protein